MRNFVRRPHPSPGAQVSRSACRSGLIAGVVSLVLWSPRTATAQSPADSVLLSLPRDSSVTCVPPPRTPSAVPDSVLYQLVVDSLNRPPVPVVRQTGASITADSAIDRIGGPLRSLSAPLRTTGSPLRSSRCLPALRGVRWLDSSEVHQQLRNNESVVLASMLLTQLAYSTNGDSAVLFYRVGYGLVSTREVIVLLTREPAGHWRIATTQQTARHEDTWPN
jgi:hypothetical protein